MDFWHFSAMSVHCVYKGILSEHSITIWILQGTTVDLKRQYVTSICDVDFLKKYKANIT